MPDNRTESGKLEHFLESMIPSDQPLLLHAKKCTQESRNHDASFREIDQKKAELACWLAWQNPPGNPYGTTIKARFFHHETDIARQVVSWVRRLKPNS